MGGLEMRRGEEEARGRGPGTEGEAWGHRGV